MNYMDRRAVGLERFFAQRSDTLSHLDEFSEEELEHRLSLLSAPTRLRLAFIIRKALNDLNKLGGELLPQEISALAGLSPFTLRKPRSMIIFLKWLRELNLRNEQQRVLWTSAMKTAASRFDDSCRSFISAFFMLSNQRVFIKKDGDRITLSLAEREWGRVSAVFEGCESENTPPFPLPGYAVACEAEALSDGIVRFSFLIDTYFGEGCFEERLISAHGWQELCFTCTGMKLDAQCVDYAENMRRCGIPKADFIDSICRIILNKRVILGTDGLNSLERSMISTISLLGGMIASSDGDLPAWQSEELIFDALDNRYAMENFSRMLNESQCGELCVIIDAAARRKAEENNDSALRAAKLFHELLERKIADGSARPLLHKLFSIFCEMSRLNDGTTARTRAARTAAERLRGNVQPIMDKLGYNGDFPHFRRNAHGKAEYVSFIIDPNSDRLHKGIMSYSASAAAAELDGSFGERCGQLGIKPEDATALDCLAEALTVSHYGELCPLDANHSPQIDINLYHNSFEITHDSTALLEEHLACIEQQFSKGRISLENRRYPERLGAAGAFFRAFIHCSPITVFAALALLAVYLLGGGETSFGLSNPHALLLVLGGGFLLNCVFSAVRCIFCSFKIWRY